MWKLQSMKYTNFHQLLSAVSGNGLVPSALGQAQANRKLISRDKAAPCLRYCLSRLSVWIFLGRSFVLYFKAFSICLYPQGKRRIKITANNSYFIFLRNKAVLSFHFDSLTQKLNHLKVKEVVDTVQGVPGLLANYICEFSDSQWIEYR